MAELQSQPAAVVDSKIESQSVDKDALIIRLDELLEKYLHTLDEYQKTREQLSKQLSSVSHFERAL
jgi:seryl-tRNA synthetase